MSYTLNLSIFRRNPNFALLFIGQFVSFFGTMITNVALPYQIYHETHSTLMVGLLSLVQLLPILFTAMIGGVFADRYHRRLLLLSAELMLAVGALLLAWNASLAKPHIWALFVISATMSAFNGLHRPALDGIVQQVVDKKDYPAVSALGMFKYSIGSIGGPAVGGIILASYGVTFTYLVDFATFAISLTALTLMRNMPRPTGARDESTFQALMQGVKYAISRQELIGSYVVDFVAMIFGMPMALFPAIAHAHGGAKVLGLLYTAPAVGTMFISLFSGWTSRVKRHGVGIAVSAFMWGVAIIGFGLTTSHMFIALLFLAFAGAFDAISGMFRGIMWNETIPQHLRGRMSGIEMISYLSGPKLGDTEAGLVAAAFGVTASIVSGGVLCLISVAACCYFLPTFWRYRSES